MAERYGTDLNGLGGFEGGVTSENGAALVSTSSDGETSLLFGPAALREIRAGIANGDFAISPDDSTATITAENPLPYWTFTDVDSAGAITCALVADPISAPLKVLRWSVAASTPAGKSATLTRYVPCASSRNRAFAYIPEITIDASATTTSLVTLLRMEFVKEDYSSTGGEVSRAATFSTTEQTINLNTGSVYLTPARNAAFAKITIEVGTLSTSPASVTTLDLYEVGLYIAPSLLAVGERSDPTTYTPAVIQQESGVLTITPATSLAIAKNTAVTGNLSATGRMTAGNVKSGRALVTVTANVVSSVSVTSVGLVTSNASAGVNDVSIVASQGSTRPDLLRAVTIANETFSGANLTAFTAYIFRTNSTDTSVYWIATGR